jgi:hypothetical protein
MTRNCKRGHEPYSAPVLITGVVLLYKEAGFVVFAEWEKPGRSDIVTKVGTAAIRRYKVATQERLGPHHSLYVLPKAVLTQPQ